MRYVRITESLEIPLAALPTLQKAPTLPKPTVKTLVTLARPTGFEAVEYPMLRGAGLLELVGARWYVSESRLRERLPDVCERLTFWLETAGAAAREGEP